MTHPAQMHATAALWSLRIARRILDAKAIRWTSSVTLDAADGLRSPRYGSRGSTGGHSDPIADALITAVDRASVWERLADRTTGTLTWLADKLHATGPGDPLGRIADTIPTLTPAAAGELHRWLVDLDVRIRTAVVLEHERQPLTGRACPACGIRQLYVQTSAPVGQRTTVCAADCTCAGPGCTCGMPVKAEGVRHIWAAEIVAVAGTMTS